MKISSSFDVTKSENRYNPSFKGVPQNPVYIPEFVGNIGKLAGEYINTPEQKLCLATAALMFEPLIDLKYADEDKNVDSAIKTGSKRIAGGITGVTIRAIYLNLAKKYIGFQKHNILNRLFMPYDAIQMKLYDPELAQSRINQYTQTMGTLFAVLTMILFTNKNIDVPLTNDLQDLIAGVVKENKSWTKSAGDVLNNRHKKIKSWFKNKKKIFANISSKTKKVMGVLKEDTKIPENSKTKEKECKT